MKEGLRRGRLLLAFLFLSIIAVFAQDNGLIKSYLPAEYGGHNQIWDIEQDEDGMMYFAHSSGITSYDGVDWKVLEGLDQLCYRSIYKDSTANVFYVGKIGDFGYVKKSDSLGFTYTSLKHLIPDSITNVSNIWDVSKVEDYIVFKGNEVVILYDPKIYQTICLTPDKNKKFVYKPLKFNNRYFISDNEGEFYEIKNKKLINVGRIPIESNNIIWIPIQNMDEYGLIYVRQYGCFKVLSRGSKLIIEKQEGEFDVGGFLYDGVVLENGELIYSSGNNGVLKIDRNSNTIQRFHEGNGMNSMVVFTFFLDKEKNLWVGTDNGITKINTVTPIMEIYQKEINANITQILELNDTIYIFTTGGIKFFAKDKLSYEIATENINIGSAWSYTKVKNKYGKDCALMSSQDGIYFLNNGKLTLVYPTSNVTYSFIKSKFKENVYWFSIGNEGVGSIEFNGENFEHLQIISNSPKSVRHLYQTKNGDFLLIMNSGGIQIMKKKNEMEYDVIEVNEINGRSTLDLLFDYRIIDGKVVVFSDLGAFVFNEDDHLFEQFNFNGQIPVNDVKSLYVVSNERDSVLFINGESKSADTLYNGVYFLEDGNFRYRTEFKRDIYSDLVFAVNLINKNTLLLGSNGKLFTYDLNKPIAYKENFKTLIREVLVNDSVVYSNWHNRKPFMEVYYKDPIRFKYSASTYYSNLPLEFRWKLNDEKWTDWKKESYVDFNQLKIGANRFTVQARNHMNHIGSETEFKVEVLPPWYRTIWAYAIYVVLLILVFRILLAIWTKRLKYQNALLEQRVEMRTKTINTQKEEIEKQANELINSNANLSQLNEVLNHKNRETMDSLKYAKTIQNAILPADEIFENTFSEFFVLLKAKDIVSGDFYWMNKVNDKTVVVAADCTGHGVPGAFMSVLGSSLLNRIVVENQICSANKIMAELNKSINDTFINLPSEMIKFGMELSVLIFDASFSQVEISGNGHKVYCIREKELIEYKTSKKDINQINEHDVFEVFTESLKKGDQFYLFSDGFPDQKGGEKGKKFYYGAFKQLLLDNSELPMSDQVEKMEQRFIEWVGDKEQVDDVLVIGIKI